MHVGRIAHRRGVQLPSLAPCKLAAVDALAGVPAGHPKDVAAVRFRVLTLQGMAVQQGMHAGPVDGSAQRRPCGSKGRGSKTEGGLGRQTM